MDYQIDIYKCAYLDFDGLYIDLQLITMVK